MTNETKHTPGPWLAQFCDVYEVKGMTRIADVLPRSKPDWTAEDHANARLIAAAPALLAACKQALIEFEALAEANIYGGPSYQLRAAIEEAQA